MAVEAPPTTATHTVVHTELAATDVKKLVAFYSNVFGWQFSAPPFMDTYHMAETSPGGHSMAIQPKQEGTVNVNYIGVPDVKAYQQKIVDAGGTLCSAFSVPQMGHGVVALDPEGNPIAIWQADPSAGMAHQVF